MKHGRKATKPEVRLHPRINELLEWAKASPMANNAILRKAGFTQCYLSQLRYGDVRNPGFIAIASIGEVLGYELVWQKKEPGK